MKKALMLLILLLITSPVFASIGVDNQGTPIGAATDVNYNCPTGTQLITGSVVNSNCGNLLAAGTANGGKASLASGQTSVTPIPLTYDFIEKGLSGSMVSTLPNGVPGQLLTILIVTAPGGSSWVITPTTSSGFSSVTFNAANQYIVFLYVNNTVGWIIHSVVGSPTITLGNT